MHQRVHLRFLAPRGFEGGHALEVEPVDAERCHLRHVLEMRASGPALLSWPLVFRPLHDTLIENLLTREEKSVGLVPSPREWSPWVKVRRRALAGGRARRRRDA